MSSTTSSAVASSSAPSSTNTPSSSPNLANSASLYLYTFLATLVLLLGVSSAIVLRSLVLRRRHRRMIEEAIRNGTYVAPNVLATARGRVDLTKKPMMWEATVLGADEKGKSGGAWGDIFPVSASISGLALGSSPVSSLTNSTATAPDSGSASATGTGTANRLRTAPGRIALGAWRLISPGPNAHPSDPLSNANSNASTAILPLHQTLPVHIDTANPTSPTHMNVAVLVAMPGALAAAANRAKEGGVEEELPHVEVGMTEIAIAGTRATQDGASGPGVDS